MARSRTPDQVDPAEKWAKLIDSILYGVCRPMSPGTVPLPLSSSPDPGDGRQRGGPLLRPEARSSSSTSGVTWKTIIFELEQALYVRSGSARHATLLAELVIALEVHRLFDPTLYHTVFQISCRNMKGQAKRETPWHASPYRPSLVAIDGTFRPPSKTRSQAYYGSSVRSEQRQ